MKARVNNIDIYYEIYGMGRPLVLLHGLGSQCLDWEYQIEPFLQNYRVIVPDARGHGRSDKPPGPYTMKQMAGDVAGLLAELNVDEAHVVGISMGGMIGFQLAVDRPSLVRSLTVINSAPAVVASNLSEKLQLWQRLALAKVLGPGGTGKFLGKRLFPNPEQDALREQFEVRWAENDKDAYYAAMRSLYGWSVADQLDKITCPVLVIGADGDYTPQESKAAYTAVLSDARLVEIKDSRHATPIDQPEILNKTVLEFLAECDGIEVGVAATQVAAGGMG